MLLFSLRQTVPTRGSSSAKVRMMTTEATSAEAPPPLVEPLALTAAVPAAAVTDEISALALGPVTVAAATPVAAVPPAAPLPMVPMLTRGMTFADGKAAFYAVQDYALCHNKQVRVASRGGKHRRMVCTGSADTPEPCPFFVQLYLHNSKLNRTWYVSSFELSHSAACSSTAKPTQRQIVAMASFRGALQASPNETALQLLKRIEGRANLRTVYRAKEAMKNALLDKFSASYKKIPSLLSTFVDLNPGAFATYEVDADSKTFTRAFISCGVFTSTTAFNQQIYGLEVVPCGNREAEYEGVQMYFFGKDGNMQNVALAAAVCNAPSRANYLWFFACLERAGVNTRYCPILCAMDADLWGIEMELGLTFRYCTRAIVEKELVQLGAFNQHHHTLIWGLQSSETEEEYHNRLEWIGTACGAPVESYLRQIPMERWVVAANIRKVALYGYRSRDFFENEDKEQNAARQLTEGLRHSLPFDFLEGMMLAYMKDTFERSECSSKWVQSGRKITPRAQELYDAQCKRVGEYKVSRASDTVAFVAQVNKSPSLRRRVDLETNTCSCAFIDQYAIPCRHLIAVLMFCDLMDTVCDRFAPAYLVEKYALAFQGKSIELPLETSLHESENCLRTKTTTSSKRQADSTGAGHNSAQKKRSKRQSTENAGGIAPATVMTDVAAASVISEADNMGSASTVTATNTLEPPPRVRLCKKCRGAGHNMRSCSFQASTSTTL